MVEAGCESFVDEPSAAEAGANLGCFIEQRSGIEDLEYFGVGIAERVSIRGV